MFDMKTLCLFFGFMVLFSCSKQEECWCNAGNGEYRHYPSYTSSGTYGHSGDLDQECSMQDRSLKENLGQTTGCELR